MGLDAMLQNAVSYSFFIFSLMQNLGKKVSVVGCAMQISSFSLG